MAAKTNRARGARRTDATAAAPARVTPTRNACPNERGMITFPVRRAFPFGFPFSACESGTTA